MRYIKYNDIYSCKYHCLFPQCLPVLCLCDYKNALALDGVQGLLLNAVVKCTVLCISKKVEIRVWSKQKRLKTAADPHHILLLICAIVNLTILSRAALSKPNLCPSRDGKVMSHLSNQHSWHQTPEQKPNMTSSRLDVTQNVEMFSGGDW